MQRVLAARSLKFVEQREEDALGYQRQFKEAHAQAHGQGSGTGGGGGGGGARGRQRSPQRGEEKEALAPGGYLSRRAMKELDLDPAGEPRRPLGQSAHSFAPGATQPAGGVFTLTYPERPSSSGAAYVRHVGEKAAVTQPLMGHASTTGVGSKDASASSAVASSSGTAATRAHAVVLVHEKKDKSDQLNMRIAAHMAAPLQKSMSALLVDEAVQRRLAKNQRKKAAIEAEVAALRKKAALAQEAQGVPVSLPPPSTRNAQRQTLRRTMSSPGLSASPAPAASPSAGALDQLAALAAAGHHSGAGQGVWSSLGQRYVEQGLSDLELPTLNTGVPLRELTKSKSVRPPPMKEASEHRKKYEALVELFRAQRHRVIQPPLRDGQNGVPRVHTGDSLGSNNSGLLASLGGGGLAGLDLNPALTDLSTDSGSAVNPANQSLLARLYQTQATQKSLNHAAAQAQAAAAAQAKAAEAAAAAAFALAQGSLSEGEDGVEAVSPKAGVNRALSHSASAVLPSRGGAGASAAGKEGLTSVDRIAALAPRKWDSSSVRPMASSASVPNFERRAVAGAAAWSGRPASQIVSLASLPDNHPAHLHPNVQAQAVSLALSKQLAAEQQARNKEDHAAVQMLAVTGAMASGGAAGGKLGSSASVGSLGGAGGSSVKFAAGSKADPDTAPHMRRQGSMAGSRSTSSLLGSSASLTDLSAAGESEETLLARRAQALALAKQKARKKRLREEHDRAVFNAVMEQLQESRLDHLHRWRNAFDGTKQKSDRLLIKKLVSRAEARQAALAGGVESLEPVVGALLAENETSLRQVVPRGPLARGASGSAGRRRGGLDYAEAEAYDEHAELTEADQAYRVLDEQERQRKERSSNQGSASTSPSPSLGPSPLPSPGVDGSFSAGGDPYASYSSRRSGLQRRHTQPSEVILEEHHEEHHEEA